MTGETWFRIRLGLLVLAFVVALGNPAREFDTLWAMPVWMVWIVVVAAALGVLAIPLMLLWVIGLQAANPGSDKQWARPTHQADPFRLGNPLLFFHFFAFVLAACALGALVSALWRGLPALCAGLTWGAAAVSTLAGVRLAMRTFKHKLAAPATAP
jgi:hypothetical protein